MRRPRVRVSKKAIAGQVQFRANEHPRGPSGKFRDKGTQEMISNPQTIEQSRAKIAAKVPFTDWIKGKLGTSRWVVARKSPKLLEKYDVFLSKKKFTSIEAQYNKAFPGNDWRLI